MKRTPQQKEAVVTSLWSYWSQQLVFAEYGTEYSKDFIREWLRDHTAQEILAAMDIAAVEYVKFYADGTRDALSCISAFAEIPAILRLQRTEAADYAGELYYVRGIARNRCSGPFDLESAITLLKAAKQRGASVEELSRIARTSNSWTDFSRRVSAALRRRSGVLPKLTSAKKRGSKALSGDASFINTAQS
jgi:hypothetical protein